MDGANLFCDVANCGRAAHVYGIKGQTKEKCCSEHMLLLTNKKMTVNDIAGYRFVSSFEDVATYEERKSIAEKGLGNLTVLEAKCDSGLGEARALLEEEERKTVAVVVRCFRETKLQVERKHEEIKRQLYAFRCDLQQFLVSKDKELHQSGRLLCGSGVASLDCIGFSVGDCSLSVAKAVMSSLTVLKDGLEVILASLDEDQQSDFVHDLCTKATEAYKQGNAHYALIQMKYAQSLGWKGSFDHIAIADKSNQAEDRKELEQLFELAVEKTHIEELANKCVEIAIAEKSALHFAESLCWLQYAWDVLEKHTIADRVTVAVGLLLGEVLCLSAGSYSEAERILRLCIDIEGRLAPMSEDSMKLSNWLTGVFYYSGQWNNAELLGVWVLQTFADANHAAEHFWTTLQYLTFACWYQDKKEEAKRVIKKWKDREMDRGNERSEVAKLTVLAEYEGKLGCRDESEKMLTTALSLSKHHFPVSIQTAVNHHQLALLYHASKRHSESEEHFHRAKSILEVVSPKSIQSAMVLTGLGLLCYSLKRFSEAEDHYQSAKSIYDEVSPQCLQAATNETSIGLLCVQLKRFREAEAHYAAGKAIYESVSPVSLAAANNLNSIGALCKVLDRVSEAEEHFSKAKAIYDAFFPRSMDAANNLYDLGLLLYDLKRLPEAETHYKEAKSIYEMVAPQSAQAASNLNSIGLIYQHLKWFSEAETHYHRAKAIYETLPEQSVQAANNLNNLGVLYQSMKRWGEAEEAYNRARIVYENVAPGGIRAANNLNNIGMLLEAMDRTEEAVCAFEKAKDMFIENQAESQAKSAENSIVRLRPTQKSQKKFKFMKLFR